jgi:hypothetical protein
MYPLVSLEMFFTVEYLFAFLASKDTLFAQSWFRRRSSILNGFGTVG